MRGMELKTFLDSREGMTAAELARAIGVKDAQVLQWKHGYESRKPSPAYCLAIERATDGIVTRKDLRPHDYWLIWPDLPSPNAKEASNA